MSSAKQILARDSLLLARAAAAFALRVFELGVHPLELLFELACPGVVLETDHGM
jgi:hypothetical protein